MAEKHPSSFVALVVEDERWRSTLLAALPPRVRALHPADVHVTLAFLGGVSPERARAAFDAAQALPLRAMAARVGPVVPLGPDGRWTALSALLLDCPELAAAMRAVRDATGQAAGVPLDHREPLPHVTLARLHANASPNERAQALDWASRLSVEVTLRLDRLALYTGRRHRAAGERAYDVVTETRLPGG